MFESSCVLSRFQEGGRFREHLNKVPYSEEAVSQNDFSIIIKLEDGVVVGHAVRRGGVNLEDISEIFPAAGSNGHQEETKEQEEDQGVSAAAPPPYPDTFSDVERSFKHAMLMYRNSVIEVIRLSPIFAAVFLGKSIQDIAKTRGTKREDLSSEAIHVYSLPDHAAFSINRHAEKSDALIAGARHLPEISTIGIISSYDAILTDLLKVVFKLKPEIIMTSDREIKFSDLVEFGSIEEARESIVSQEIEGAIRQSHHDQFAWMERKFGMPLTKNLEVWPDFVELCERRNLLTHTGGVVSRQYLKNCEAHGKKCDLKPGDRLEVDVQYFRSAIEIVSEVGFKLIHTLWRKFSPSEREAADEALNALGMDLIANKRYSLAERILQFGVDQKHHHSDLIRRMMVVNLANAAKLGGHKDRCNKALSAHDWSATSYQFQICVAAVKNDFPEVVRLMCMGADVLELSSSQFRDWPVFKDARTNAEVQKTFEQTFGEPLHLASEKTVSSDVMSDEVLAPES